MSLLVTAAEVKKHTQAGPNADEEKLAKAVPDATAAYLRPLVGAALLAELLVLAGDGFPVTPALAGLGKQAEDAALAAYATALDTWRTAHAGPLLELWDALKPCLAQWTLYQAWPDLLVHIDAAGVVMKTGSASGTTSGDVATVNMVRNHHRETAISRGNELVSWLEARRTSYPAYVSTRPGPTNAQPLDLCGGLDLS